MQELEEVDFNFEELWNAVTGSPDEDREYKPRDYVYASELGGSMLDRYLKMKGEPYTNPPNDRSYRKFYSGDKCEEDVANILIAGGMKYRTQEKVSVQYPDVLRVSGRIDFIVEKVGEQQEINSNWLPKSKRIAQRLNQLFAGKKIRETVLELKSISGLMMDMLIKKDNPRTTHMLQAALYKKATGLSTHIVYLSRDDSLIKQYKIDDIFGDLETMILADLKAITYYYQNNIQPKPEKMIILEDGKFKKNQQVEWSCFLTRFYGYVDKGGNKIMFNEPIEYRKWVTSEVGKWNRAINKLLSGKKLKDDQLTYLKSIEQAGYNIEEIKSIFIEKAKNKEEAENEIEEEI